MKGDLEVDLEVDLEGDFRGDFRGDFKQDLVQVQFRKELIFNSFELDSEVGRLVYLFIVRLINSNYNDPNR